MKDFKTKTFLIKAYIQMLLFDILQFWSYKENRKESKAIYKMIKIMHKPKN